MPELQDELQKLIQSTEKSILQLPKPPSADPVNEILHLISDFIQDLSVHIEGTPGAHGLLQQIRPAQIDFKKAIRSTAPNFRATTKEQDDAESRKEAAASLRGYLANEEDTSMIALAQGRVIYISEVMDRALL